MKNFILFLLLGTCLNASWAHETLQSEVASETPIQKALEPLESHPRKFAELARTTMDLMSPELETAQNDEQESKHLQN